MAKIRFTWHAVSACTGFRRILTATRALQQDFSTENITLTNIINETIQEKVFIVSALELIKDDSVKITNPNDNSLDLISYGLEKNYQIELNFPTQSGMGRFLNSNIALTQNTTHKLVPNWEDFTDLKLTIYIDEGNNGSIDDTIEIQNQVTGVGEDQGALIPTEYYLPQKFPNPFNPSTTIKYSIPKSSLVTLKVYDILGSEVMSLVNEEKQPSRPTRTKRGSTQNTS